MPFSIKMIVFYLTEYSSNNDVSFQTARTSLFFARKFLSVANVSKSMFLKEETFGLCQIFLSVHL